MKDFYKTFKPFQGGKNRSLENDLINIKVNGNIEKDQNVVAETMAEYFATIGHNVGVQQFSPFSDEEFYNHPSVARIRKQFNAHDPFRFRQLNAAEVEESLKNLKSNKTTGWDQISPGILKLGALELTAPLTKLFNSVTTSGEYPNCWKKGVWVPIYKKHDKTDKRNYRPHST